MRQNTLSWCSSLYGRLVCHIFPPARFLGLFGSRDFGGEFWHHTFVVLLSFFDRPSCLYLRLSGKGHADWNIGLVRRSQCSKRSAGHVGSPLLLWALRKEKLWLLCLTAFLGFGLLYATGTRLTYFSAVLTAAGMLVLLLWNRKPLRFCLPLLLALVLLLGLKGFSPMEQRQMRSLDSNELYREKTEAVMGSDMGYAYRKGEEIPAEVKEKLERLYTEVYGVPGPYKLPLLGI